MWRSILGVILSLALLALPLAATAQGYPVYDNLQYILQSTSWGQQFASWATQLARMVQQYNQLVTTYQYMQHLAKQLQHPDVYTVLSLFAITPSGQLTQIQNIGQFRGMVEGSIGYSNQLGQLYHRIYGQPITVGSITPTGPTDWTGAANRINDMIQANDAAITESLAVQNKVNGSLNDLNTTGTYTTLKNQIMDPNITPEQTAQAGALSSLYGAQSVDKLTQVLTASAGVQAAQAAQQNAAMKNGLIQGQIEHDYYTSQAEASRNDDQVAASWTMP